jgi:hypothetical protein
VRRDVREPAPSPIAVATTTPALPAASPRPALPTPRAPQPAVDQALARAAEELEREGEAVAEDEVGEAPRRRRRRRGERAAVEPAETRSGSATTTKEHVEGTIDTSNGREFWEAWVDSKNGVEPETAPLAPELPSEPARRGRSERPEREAERGRRGRRERSPRGIPEVPAGQARLYLNLGLRDGAEEEQVRALLTEHGVQPHALDVMSSHSYLNVDESVAEEVIARLSATRFGTRALKCERAKP